MKITNLDLADNLQEPTAFFDLDGATYALLLGGSEKVLNGEMTDIDNNLTEQLQVDQNWDAEATEFIFDDFKIIYSNNSLSFELF